MLSNQSRLIGGTIGVHTHQLMRNAAFPLGRIVVTIEAARVLPLNRIEEAVKRHGNGDWGIVSSADVCENNQNRRTGGQIISEYLQDGQRFFIRTDQRQPLTMVLLSSELLG